MSVGVEELHRYALCAILSNKSLSFEDAEDMAQQAILVYLKHNNNVTQPKSYISSICRNLVADKFRAQKKFDQKVSEIYENTVDTENPCEKSMETLAGEKTDVEEILKIIPKKFHELFHSYAEVGFRQADLARNLGGNYNTIKSKVYTINTYIKSYFMIQEGYVYSLQLLNRQQKENLHRFIKKFIHACEIQDANDMYGYFPDNIRDDINLGFRIVKFVKFGIERNEEQKNSYKVTVTYIDGADKERIFNFLAKFKGNRLKIIKPPEKPRTASKLSRKAIEMLCKELGVHSLADAKRHLTEPRIMKRLLELHEKYPPHLNSEN